MAYFAETYNWMWHSGVADIPGRHWQRLGVSHGVTRLTNDAAFSQKLELLGTLVLEGDPRKLTTGHRYSAFGARNRPRFANPPSRATLRYRRADVRAIHVMGADGHLEGMADLLLDVDMSAPIARAELEQVLKPDAEARELQARAADDQRNRRRARRQGRKSPPGLRMVPARVAAPVAAVLEDDEIDPLPFGHRAS